MSEAVPGPKPDPKEQAMQVALDGARRLVMKELAAQLLTPGIRNPGHLVAELEGMMRLVCMDEFRRMMMSISAEAHEKRTKQ